MSTKDILENRTRYTQKAVKSLLKHCKESDAVYLQISLKDSLVKQRSLTPVLIRIPHSYYGTINNASILLIVKDPASKYQKELDEDPKSATKGIFTEIISVTKLKRRLKTTRDFLESFNIILIQDRVSNIIASKLGDKIYKSSKSIPISISMDTPKTKNIASKIDSQLVYKQVKRIIKCTRVVLAPGNSLTVLIGYGNMGDQTLRENTDAALDLIATNLIKDKENLISAFVKTPESAALPILSEAIDNKNA